MHKLQPYIHLRYSPTLKQQTRTKKEIKLTSTDIVLCYHVGLQNEKIYLSNFSQFLLDSTNHQKQQFDRLLKTFGDNLFSHY